MSNEIRPSGPYSFGSRNWPGLAKVVEECGELLQIAGKLMMVGGDTHHWSDPRLDLRLFEELADVSAAVRAFFALNSIAGNPDVMEREQAKYVQFLKWHSDNVEQPDDRITEHIEEMKEYERPVSTNHILKVVPQFWPDIISGRKNFEVRINNRNFQVGDKLILRFFNPVTGAFGDTVERVVTYVLTDEQFPLGLKSGFAVLGLREVERG